MEPRPICPANRSCEQRLGAIQNSVPRRGDPADGALERVEEMSSVKLAEWVADKLSAHGVTHAFMVTGGGAMHLNHAIGSHPKIETVFNHHEQACAIAAEGYYRIANRLPVVNVTSGPGGTNAITGVYGAVRRFYRNVGPVRTSEMGNDGPQHWPSVASIRRPGAGHRRARAAHHQVLRDGHGPARAFGIISRRRFILRRCRPSWSVLA